MSVLPKPRADLPYEAYVSLDGSGDHTAPWLDSASVTRVRVACDFNGGTPVVAIEEGIYAEGESEPKTVRTQPVPVTSLRAYAELDITARFFRLTVDGGLSDNPFTATLRSV